MQVSSNGERYAACDVPRTSVGWEVTFNGFPDGTAVVNMWNDAGENHWTMSFTDVNQAIREYNKWARVPEQEVQAA